VTGGFVYTPDLNFNGQDSFSYHVNDGQLDSQTVVVTITVAPVNDSPVAIRDSYTTTEDIALVIEAPGLLDNDSDIDGDQLTAVLGQGVAHGQLVVSPDGGFVYTPTANFYGQDSFTYQAMDGVLLSDPVTVTLTISSVNDIPVGATDQYSTTEDVVLSVSAPGVLTNDSDVDGDPLTVELDEDVTHGELLLNPDGSFIYTPTLGHTGEVTFTYRLSDGRSESSAVTVVIIVEPQPLFAIYLPFVLKE
jgi:VCBS repeat-containing protein